MTNRKPLFTSNEWTVDSIDRVWNVINKIAKEKYNLTYAEPQIELISSEQMLDAFASSAMPVMYDHWSFGKEFIKHQEAYKKGQSQLAYEVVINTDPLITYLMEDNSMTMMALVLAHSICGHGSFFKNNYVFKKWTKPEAILDYLVFAKKYVAQCEEKYGIESVDKILDAAHAIQYCGIDKYKRNRSETKKNMKKKTKQKIWNQYKEDVFDDLWRTIPNSINTQDESVENADDWPHLPEENLLYYLEKYSPILKEWERELLRIVRKIAQYLYPQLQTKMMNEGWASFIHYQLMTDLYDDGHITEGSYLEFLHSHTSVCNQPCCKGPTPFYNVYALGFDMFKEIKRICEHPEPEDYKHSPDLCGKNWLEEVTYAMENFRDESFILQYLTPNTVNKFKMFILRDDSEDDKLSIEEIQDQSNLKRFKKLLARQFDCSLSFPHIEIVSVDWNKSRTMKLINTIYDNRQADYTDSVKTMCLIEHLWGHSIHLDDKFIKPGESNE